MYQETFMRMALAEAAADPSEVPVGAVVVKDGQLLARARNTREKDPPDPFGHAEINAMREAARRLRTRRLTGCELYVTLEPCPMCAGAMIQAELSACYYAASDPEQGCCGSVYALNLDPAFTHHVPAAGGYLRGEAERQLRDFFDRRRNDHGPERSLS